MKNKLYWYLMGFLSKILLMKMCISMIYCCKQTVTFYFIKNVKWKNHDEAEYHNGYATWMTSHLICSDDSRSLILFYQNRLQNNRYLRKHKEIVSVVLKAIKMDIFLPLTNQVLVTTWHLKSNHCLHSKTCFSVYWYAEEILSRVSFHPDWRQ